MTQETINESGETPLTTTQKWGNLTSLVAGMSATIGAAGLGFYESYTGESTTPSGIKISIGSGYTSALLGMLNCPETREVLAEARKVRAAKEPVELENPEFHKLEDLSLLIGGVSLGMIAGAAFYGIGYAAGAISRYF